MIYRRNDMNLGVIIVTYNRKEKLKRTLSCYENQSKKINLMIIVDNCSTDGTKQFLEEYTLKILKYKVKVLNMSENIGGAGGFFEGMKYAMQEKLDWVYVSDDDAYVNSSTLKEIESIYTQLEEKDKIVALCSVVKNEDGIDYGHRLRLNKKIFTVKWYPVNKIEYKKPYFNIDIFSYVGTAIKINNLFITGLDRKDFFIYHDDQEHSLRLRNTGKILTCTKSTIYHDTKSIKYKKLFWGNYYDTRNRLLMIRYNFPPRYYYVRFILGYIRDCIMCRDKIKRDMMKEAYSDARKQNMGVNKTYNPEWK